MECQAKITDFICREMLFNDKSRLPTPDAPLLGTAGGVVDSVGLHQLISFLETEFGLIVDDLDIVPENFESLHALEAYVQRKIAEKQAK